MKKTQLDSFYTEMFMFPEVDIKSVIDIKSVMSCDVSTGF